MYRHHTTETAPVSPNSGKQHTPDTLAGKQFSHDGTGLVLSRPKYRQCYNGGDVVFRYLHPDYSDYLVTACNNHAALVAALEDVTDALETLWRITCKDLPNETIKTARAALAQAKGEQK